MTAKQFVLERYPSASAFFFTPKIVIIHDNEGTKFHDFGCHSDTEESAWQNAKAKIEETEKEKSYPIKANTTYSITFDGNGIMCEPVEIQEMERVK